MVGTMAFSFTGCGNAQANDSNKEATAESTETASENLVEAVSAETETVESEKETDSAGETETETEKSETTKTAVPLTDEEKDILEQMGEDIIVVTEDDYAEVVEELQYHTGEFNGKVYQLEGLYTAEADGVPYVSRTLINDGEKTVCGLPIAYLEKEIETDSWVRVTGIVNEGEVDKETVNVLEVVAIEVLAERGNAELEWDGAAHQH